MEYLTEKSLGEYLKLIFNVDFIHNKRFKHYKFRPDYVNHELKIVVEFDGYHHYQNSDRILKDYENENIMRSFGYKIVRIPYFIQLTKKVVSKLFDVEIEDDFYQYPQGFIDKKCLKPYDFCFLGLERFKKDLETFNFIKDLILNSFLYHLHLDKFPKKYF